MLNEGGPETGEQIYIHFVQIYNWSECVFLEKFCSWSFCFIYLFFLPSFTLDIEAVSCDEMFVDCTGVLQHSCTSPMQFASFLRQEIEVH
jgi:hypothetical protein